MRVEPRALNELLHRQVDPDADRDVLARGIAASPGAAAGAIVFSAAEAQAYDARGEACIPGAPRNQFRRCARHACRRRRADRTRAASPATPR